MVATSTSSKQREKLHTSCFVRVDGLQTYQPGGDPDEAYVIGVGNNQGKPGTWDYSNGMTVVYTNGGECWLRSGLFEDKNFLKEFAPNGRGAFVPCSGGEALRFYEILKRMVDPDWIPKTAE